LTLPDLTREIFFYLVEQGDTGVSIWDVERAFPARMNLKRCLDSLVARGLARVEHEPHGVSTWRRYVRTGKPLGPQAKLTAFAEATA
jgi:hypothetical protein